MSVETIERMLEVPCDLQRLKQVRAFVCDACRESGVVEETMYDLQIAASELAANIMRHAMECDKNRSFTVEIKLTPQTAQLVFLHDGKPFNPNNEVVPEPKFDGTQDHGFGLFLIRKIMDSSRYLQTAEGMNRVVLTRRLNSKKQERDS
jgi:anti-sigma regulatory factor (Ser/Thr protein kinase)